MAASIRAPAIAQRGVDPAKLQQVSRWRESAAFDDRERAALEFAEAVTLTPAHVPGELAQRLHHYFTEAELAERRPPALGIYGN